MNRRERTNVQTDADRRGRSPEYLAEVARAYYERDLTQAQIADQLGISRSQVSRYLQAARDEGIVQIRVVGAGSRIPDLEKALRHRFPHLREAIVVPAFASDGSVVMSTAARAAARYVEEIIAPGNTVCFGAGRHLATLVKMLGPSTTDGVTVVQAMGNAGHEGLDIDYNAIAHTAAQAFGGRAIQINAPAVLGPGATADDLENSNSSIHGALSRARSADVYVVGIGSVAGDAIYVTTGVLARDDLDSLAADGAVGDICANFFDLRGRPVPASFSDRAVGIRHDDLQRAPTVVACATGAGKVAGLTGALTGRYVDVLVTDEHAARGVVALVGDAPSPRED